MVWCCSENWRLSKAEFEDWKSRAVISSPSAKLGLRHAPFVFTQEGVATLSVVLRIDRAVQRPIGQRVSLAHVKYPTIARPKRAATG
jgi:hypothetical protein